MKNVWIIWVLAAAVVAGTAVFLASLSYAQAPDPLSQLWPNGSSCKAGPHNNSCCANWRMAVQEHPTRTVNVVICNGGGYLAYYDAVPYSRYVHDWAFFGSDWYGYGHGYFSKDDFRDGYVTVTIQSGYPDPPVGAVIQLDFEKVNFAGRVTRMTGTYTIGESVFPVRMVWEGDEEYLFDGP